MNQFFQKTAYNFVMGNLTNRLPHTTTQQSATMLTYVVKNITPHTAQDLTLTETLLRYFINLHRLATEKNLHLNGSMALTKDAPPISPQNLSERRNHTLAVWEAFENSIPLTPVEKPSQSLAVLQEILNYGTTITNNGQTKLYPDDTSLFMPGYNNPNQMITFLNNLTDKHHIRF